MNSPNSIRGAHAQGGVTSPAVVEDFQIVEDGVWPIRCVVPAFSVERLGLHSAPERFDDRVDAAISDRRHRGHRSGPLSARWTMTPDRGSRLAMAILRALVTTAAVWLVSMDEFQRHPGDLKA